MDDIYNNLRMNMPTKFKPTDKSYDRRTGNFSTTYNYMKGTSKDDLFSYINSTNAQPKVVHKCIQELTRRGIKIEWS